MVSEQKKATKSGGTIMTILIKGKKKKKATVYLLEVFFWLKYGELLKVLYFSPLCQCLGLNQGHFYFF